MVPRPECLNQPYSSAKSSLSALGSVELANREQCECGIKNHGVQIADVSEAPTMRAQVTRYSFWRITMRIITLGRVAGIGEGDDHFYEGSGYLLRFSIDSADEFFAMQLPFIVATLGIDVRQIMRLELLGDGYSGLRQAMLCISFEDPTSEGERPENALAKLSASPSTPPSNSFTDD